MVTRLLLRSRYDLRLKLGQVDQSQLLGKLKVHTLLEKGTACDALFEALTISFAAENEVRW